MSYIDKARLVFMIYKTVMVVLIISLIWLYILI